MAIRIFFILSFFVLLAGILFIYKVPEKVSLFRSIIICYITELCSGAVVIGIYIVAGVTISLLSLGIAYFIMGITSWGVIIYQKKIQKMTIIICDVYTVIIIGLWFAYIFIKLFTPSVSNIYINVDPIAHYQLALNVLETGKTSVMYFAEVYNAIIIELLSPFLNQYSLYKAFVLADTFANLINVFMFYCMAAMFIKAKFSKIILPFLCFLYFAGWPFFSYAIGGFVYFGWGVTLFSYVVYLLIKLYDCEDKRNQIALLGLVLLGGFSVLVCYLLFIVILTGIVLLSLMCIARKNGFTLSKKQILKIGGIIFILACGMFAFFFWGYFGGELTYILNALKTNGWIAKELYQDFIYLMPAVFYMGWKYIKNREVNIIAITVGVILAYIICTFILCVCGIMSPYYYYKSYYLLWFFVWILNIAFIEYLLKKDKVMLFSCGGTLFLAILITLSGFDSRLEQKGVVAKDIWVYPSAFPIWDYMEGFLEHDHYLNDKDAATDVSKYVNETFMEQEDIPMISDNYIAKWYSVFTDNSFLFAASDVGYAHTIQECIDQGYQYIVIYQNTERYRDNIEFLSDFESIYDNGYYGIYKLQ